MIKSLVGTVYRVRAVCLEMGWKKSRRLSMCKTLTETMAVPTNVPFDSYSIDEKWMSRIFAGIFQPNGMLFERDALCFKGKKAVDVEFTPGKEIFITTHGSYAMDTAINVLEYLERQHHARIAETGWKNGYEIEVAVEIPISFRNCTVGLYTDGALICIKRVSGSKQEYDEIVALVYRYVSGRVLNQVT